MAEETPDFAAVDAKWQKKWADTNVFEASEDPTKEKCYVVEMYPYPSGSGLHMGHLFNYTIGDVYARLKIMQGYNVMHPMGYDSFGLPAENAAIKAKSHPKKFTEDAIKSFIAEQKRFGITYDWSRVLESHDPKYYTWDQWIFLQLYKKGLAYRKKAPVNWCPECNTVLANEQVQNGKCWRHEETDVIVKNLDQWFFKTTAYAEELYDKIDSLTEWPEMIKKLQRNWIGKSHGTEVVFDVNGAGWPVFTTRADTLFGVTFLVVSAQHSKLGELVTPEQREEVDGFLKKISSVSEENTAVVEKEGVFTGSYALHPLTGEKMPIWAGNFVLADYGSGMVMAVPAHDQRDYAFAKKYDLPIKRVVEGESKDGEAFTGYGVLINSEGFNGLKSEEAKEHITTALEMKERGKHVTNYRLRDWLVSRQRFWGTPIPIIYCEKCGAVPVPEEDLPVKLPDDVHFESVENPLKSSEAFVNVACPTCGGKGKRETDTMDTFVNSSWYFLRYCDPHNVEKIFESKKVDYWCPVDLYIGGKEHACMHLIYARFYTKFLRDLGLLSFDEPFKRLFNQGYIYGTDGRKMSKSYGNVVLPDAIAQKYGVDAMRMFVVSVASPDKDFNWSDAGVEGAYKFVNRVMRFVSEFKEGSMTPLQESKLHRTIKEYSEDLENFRYNLGVIKLRQLFDVLEEGCSSDALKIFVRLLSPICPHIAEELWVRVGGKGFVSTAHWPEFDGSKIDDKLEQSEKNVMKTVDDVKTILGLMKEKTGTEGSTVYLYVIPPEKVQYDATVLSERLGKEVIVYAINDADKHDPENKSAKVKPGRPGIYIE